MSVKYKRGAYHVDVQMRGFPAIRRRLDVDDEKSAKRVEAWVKLQLQAGVEAEDIDISDDGPRRVPKRAKTMTMAEALDRALRTTWSRSKSLRSFFEPVGRRTIERLGPDSDIAQVDDDAIRLMVSRCLDAGDRPSTVNRRLALLSRLWTVAAEEWDVEGLQRIRWGTHRLRTQSGRMRWLTRSEEQRLLEALETMHRDHAQEMRDLVIVAIDTGLRRGEAQALRPEDVSWEYNSITVSRSGDTDSTKSGKTRAVPMTKRVRDVLDRRSRYRECVDADRLFPAMTNSRMRLLWGRAKADIGLADDREFVFHACRHTCGTRLAEAGNDIRLIQAWLGHEDIETTTIYTKVTGMMLERGAASLDEL